MRITAIAAATCIWWRGWRPVPTDPPPLGAEVLGLCSYTGVLSVTARLVEPSGYRHWDRWHHSFPTHWQNLPRALPLTPAPPASAPIYERSTEPK